MPLFEVESWLGNTLALPLPPAVCHLWGRRKKNIWAYIKSLAKESFVVTHHMQIDSSVLRQHCTCVEFLYVVQ